MKVSKEVHDFQLHFFVYKVFGLFLLSAGKHLRARQLFLCIRDVTAEC
jgi:hypothetical protein